MAQSVILSRVSNFFSSYFLQIRRQQDFAVKVQSWLVQIKRAMAEDQSCGPLNSLIAQIAQFDSVQQSDGSEGEADD